MEYYESFKLKDGRACILRNGTEADGAIVLENYLLTHEQTDFLTTYADEISRTAEEEGKILQEKTESPNEILILAEVDGVLAGDAGITAVGAREKLRHRAEFGIAIDRAYWELGIGIALAKACIECAKKAGYEQLELIAVADNERALSLYRKVGFEEFGRNPRGFKVRPSGYQELVYMKVEL